MISVQYNTIDLYIIASLSLSLHLLTNFFKMHIYALFRIMYLKYLVLIQYDTKYTC